MLQTYGYTTQIFDSESAFETYVQSESYSTESQICFAITVQSSSSSNYKYKLRFNISTSSILGSATDGPAPTLDLTEAQGIDLDLYSATLGYGMIGTNTLISSAILQL